MLAAGGGAGGLLWALSPGPPATPRPYTNLRSRPDLNGAPGARILKSTGREQPDYIFLSIMGRSPNGTAAFDNAGHLLWWNPGHTPQIQDISLVHYDGQSLLQWFEGQSIADFGQGERVLVNNHYEQVATVRAQSGPPLDLHAFLVTPQGTALCDAFEPRIMDLTSIGGAKNTTVYGWLVEEIDIATGKTLFTWSSFDHVDFAESVIAPPTSPGNWYDYFHGNSIDFAPDGNLIISARNTSTIYKLDRTSGEVLWRLRGARTGVAPSPSISLQPRSESFWMQHDARWNADGTLSMFDDGGGPPYEHSARGLVLTIDEHAATATVKQAFDLGLRVSYQGSTRLQPNGNWLVDWGELGRITEFSPAGDIVFDMAFSGQSYIAVRSPWAGIPPRPPDVAAERAGTGTARVWASWNGSTNVRSWRVLAGSDPHSLAPAGIFPWADLETAMTVHTTGTVLAVEALDGQGHSLATSRAISL